MATKNKDAVSNQTKAAAAQKEPEAQTKTNDVTPSGDILSADTTQSTAKSEAQKTELPKVSDTAVKIGKTLLKSNPAMSEVFMTSDGRGFYEKNDADNHARTLNNKIVTPVKK